MIIASLTWEPLELCDNQIKKLVSHTITSANSSCQLHQTMSIIGEVFEENKTQFLTGISRYKIEVQVLESDDAQSDDSMSVFI